MEPMTRLGVLVNFTRPGAAEALGHLCHVAEISGVTLFAPPEHCNGFEGLHPCPLCKFVENGVQGVISLGGDGSLLSAVHMLSGIELPIIGFNIGHLGYLTAVNEEGFGTALKHLATGVYRLEPRSTLVAFTDNHPNGTPEALNDIVIARQAGGHALPLKVSLDGNPVARYLCDGVILSTPTGSTAYALSVGGPVVAPQARVFVLSVIAPHALTARPLVIPSDTRVAITVDHPEEGALLCIDGRETETLSSMQTIHIQQSAKSVHLILPHVDVNPYARLSRKLGWSSGFMR
jgi:NAD+ kinase